LDDEGVITEEGNYDIEIPSNNYYRMDDAMKIRHRNNRSSSSSSGKKSNRRRKSSSSVSPCSKANEQLSHNNEGSSYGSLEPERKRRPCRKSKRNIPNTTTINDKNKQSITCHPCRRDGEATTIMKHDDDKSNNGNKTSSRRRSVNKTKPVVHFANHDQVIHIPHIVDIPQEEIDQCWMNEEDHSFIRSRTLRLIQMMEDEEKQYPISADTNTMMVDNHLVCVRGLEEKTSPCVYERDELQRKLYTAVFSVQHQHRQQKEEQCVVDRQEAIRQASKKYSKTSNKLARLVGISDEANAFSSNR